MPLAIYRPELPDYLVVPMVARAMAGDLIGTFHEREGEQSWVSAQAAGHNAWMRIFGGPYEQEGGGPVDPAVDGSKTGIQVGAPLWSTDHDDGGHDRIGIAVGYSQLLGDVRGDVLGIDDLASGKIDTRAYSAGLQWTHVWASQGYLDVVGQYTWLKTDTHAFTQVDARIDADVVSASVEVGYPWRIGARWQLEPQAQLIWSRVQADDFSDLLGDVRYEDASSVTWRAGARLVGDFDDTRGSHYRPFLRLNVIHTPDGDDRAWFDDIAVANARGATAWQLGVGLSAGLSDSAQLYTTVDYTADLDGGRQRILTGRLGVRWAW